MATKRKRSAAREDEERAPKRQLRSRTIELQTPAGAPTKVYKASNTLSASLKEHSKKRNTKSTLRQDLGDNGRATDDSDDELDIGPQQRPLFQMINNDCELGSSCNPLQTETNLKQVLADKDINDPEYPRVETRRSGGVARRSTSQTRIAKTAADDERALPADQDTSVKRSQITGLQKTPVRRQPKRGPPVVEVTIRIPRKKSKITPPHLPSPSVSPSVSPNFQPSPLPCTVDPVGNTVLEIQDNSHAAHPKSVPRLNILPHHLHPCLNAQKRAVLHALQRPPSLINGIDEEISTNELATRQLSDLIEGTVLRAEGNSCLLLGPRGSGKSGLMKSCLESLDVKPIVLYLSGWAQSTDRHALREIASQLLRQTGSCILPDSERILATDNQEMEEDDNPFLNPSNEPPSISPIALPPSSHLHVLIPILSTLDRPVIVILDAFDLFALHPRQSLLYCLLDTVQNCRADSGSRGIAVIGVTSRVDTIQLLEKRVKSRFSGRTIRTAPPADLKCWKRLIRSIMHPPDFDDSDAEWKGLWGLSVDKLLMDETFLKILDETFSITRDVQAMTRIMMTPILQLNPGQPYLSARAIAVSLESQRSRLSHPGLSNLSYPSLCLLIASTHADTAGHTTFTFEMLFNNFRDQVRASTSAPVQVNGGSIGMVRCSRGMLMSVSIYPLSRKTF
ncbi:origin recognition complex subunit 4 C-terminus-domain-containing protein [Crassisporium funariophilum]|nr:origin recognition complex subunit 4 C-terminus-domain-containing protein [Crassisporium funariophilum]